MDEPEKELPAPTTETGPIPPEVLNPDSPRYQPWLEKQIFNATKEKRPLEEFLAEFEARVAAQGQPAVGGWDPGRNERLLAKYSIAAETPRRRRRRRPASKPTGPAPARTGRRPVQPATASSAPAETGPSGERRRRRRRRPRGGRPPEAAAT